MLRLGKEVMIFDGGFGSELERAGLSAEFVEDLNITHPEEIKKIHISYAEAGADFITTNTFGLNRIKYHGKYDLKTLAHAAIKNARAAGKTVFFDIGPTGALLKPYGTLEFDEVYEAYREIVELTRDDVDGYIAETFSDLYEAKACLLAIKENSNKPVFFTMTFDKNSRTLTGSTPEIVANTLELLGADALGVNCSLGPKELGDCISRMLAVSHIPVIVQPNRALPTIKNGKTHYDMSAEEFSAAVGKFVDMGVSVIGGCCGTTPEFIKELSKYRLGEVPKRDVPYRCAVNSARGYVLLDGVRVCGERLNPTGKKKLKEALADGNFDYVISEAIKQEESGADILDINVGVPKTDEPSLMLSVLRKVQEYVDTPVQIDSSKREAVEIGARYCNGIPIINSVNGDNEVMDAIFPIAKKYGAAVIGLTLDSRGVPRSAEERLAIAKKIIDKAESYGIGKHRIIIDTLTLTASAEQELVGETLRALSLVSQLGVRTTLGVSNISFGLPERGLLNRTFLASALANGLTMPIINPLDSEMMNVIRAHKVLSGEDSGAGEYISFFANSSEGTPTPTPVETSGSLYGAVRGGLRSEIERLALDELALREPMDIINNTLISALSEVGSLYESGKIFLPQLISSAEAAKTAFSVISDRFPKQSAEKARIVLATVKGDIHDIGKNIVKVVLESYGYRVIDLGKDVPPEKIAEACKTHKAVAIGLSALMTTTVLSMEATIAYLRQEGIDAPIFVGGAVLTAETAKEIGADYYTENALETVKLLEKIL